MRFQEFFKEEFQGRDVIYTAPDLEVEWEEANRYPEFQKSGKDKWFEIAKQGKVVRWSELDNVGNVEQDLYSLDQNKVKQVAVDIKRNKIELPIVGQWSDGHLDLISGNTRIASLLNRGHDPKVWLINVPDGIEENFADGKKPGRKGLSKRVGIPQKATLGQLEKIAKSSTGERRRMAQWQLNMRRGRARK
jgi:hypothetical protein